MSAIVALCAGLGIAFLLASIRWAARRYARFDKLPQHFGLRGEATVLGPPALIVWQLPALFILVLLALAAMFVLVPADMQNGDPAIGMLVASLSLAAAHGFVLWLTERWARAPG